MYYLSMHRMNLASYDEIMNNSYNLSTSTYVEAEVKRVEIDISKVNAEIENIVEKENILREAIKRIIEEMEG